MGLFALAWRWFRSQAFESAIVSLIGYGLMVLALPALLTLWKVPDVRGAIPPGGLLGTLATSGLHELFGAIGAHVVAVALFVTALFLTTSFTFSGTHALLRGPLNKLNPVAMLKARWKAWHEEREQARLRKRLETIKVAGRQPVTQKTVGTRELRKPVTEEEDEHPEPAADVAEKEYPAPIFVMPESGVLPPKKASAEPKISKGAASFRLPSPGLLRMAERNEKIEEDELKECAHAIEQKVREFDVGGHVTQINPGPVVTTYEFKPEAGIKYSRITGLTDDLCLALKAESILIERIPGKSTVGIEVPNQHRQTIALREVIESRGVRKFRRRSSRLRWARISSDASASRIWRKCRISSSPDRPARARASF